MILVAAQMIENLIDYAKCVKALGLTEDEIAFYDPLKRTIVLLK